MDRTTHKLVHGSIQTRHAPYFNMGGLSNNTLSPTVPGPPSQTVPEQPGSVPAGMLQDFEYPDCFYNVFQVTGELTTEQVQEGSYSLKMTGTGGEWHTIGAYLYNRPIDATGYNQICVWIYDTVGRNTVGIRLHDQNNNNKEVWSRTRTQKDRWKLICLSLSDFADVVDLTTLTRVQLTMYWDGVYYWDHLHLN